MITVSVIGKIELDCPFEKALTYIQTLENITDYEPKISRAQTQAFDQQRGAYSTLGFFSCVPWRGRFEYTLHEQGFHSYMVEGLMARSMQGGFVIFPLGENRCQLWHYEEYRFPPFLGRLLRLSWRRYLHYAMENELRDIEIQLVKNVQPNTSLSVSCLDIPILPEVVSEVSVDSLFDLEADANEREMRITATSTTLTPVLNS